MSKEMRKLINQPKRKPIDMEMVKKLFQIYCTIEEVAYTIGVSVQTLRARVHEEEFCTLEELAKKYRNIGNASLKRTGYLMAQNDKTVWIFFAKNYLGMSDKQEINVNGLETNITNNSVILQMTDEQKLKMLEHMRVIGLVDENGEVIQQKQEEKNE